MKPLIEKDANTISYEDFGMMMKSLLNKIQKYSAESKAQLDIVVPILRSGGIPGSIVANYFGIINMLPVQFKYFYNERGVELKQMLTIPKILNELSKIPNIIICELNTDDGDTAKVVVDLLKRRFPDSNLYYSTVSRFQSSPKAFRGIKEYFYGKEFRRGVVVYPWNKIEEELKNRNTWESSQKQVRKILD